MPCHKLVLGATTWVSNPIRDIAECASPDHYARRSTASSIYRPHQSNVVFRERPQIPCTFVCDLHSHGTGIHHERAFCCAGSCCSCSDAFRVVSDFHPILLCPHGVSPAQTCSTAKAAHTNIDFTNVGSLAQLAASRGNMDFFWMETHRTCAARADSARTTPSESGVHVPAWTPPPHPPRGYCRPPSQCPVPSPWSSSLPLRLRRDSMSRGENPSDHHTDNKRQEECEHHQHREHRRHNFQVHMHGVRRQAQSMLY